MARTTSDGSSCGNMVKKRPCHDCTPFGGGGSGLALVEAPRLGAVSVPLDALAAGGEVIGLCGSKAPRWTAAGRASQNEPTGDAALDGIAGAVGCGAPAAGRGG